MSELRCTFVDEIGLVRQVVDHERQAHQIALQLDTREVKGVGAEHLPGGEEVKVATSFLGALPHAKAGRTVAYVPVVVVTQCISSFVKSEATPALLCYLEFADGLPDLKLSDLGKDEVDMAIMIVLDNHFDFLLLCDLGLDPYLLAEMGQRSMPRLLHQEYLDEPSDRSAGDQVERAILVALRDHVHGDKVIS